MLFYGLRKWYMLGLMKPFQTPPDKLQKMHLGYAVNKAVKGADTMRVFKYRHSLIQATTIYSSPNIIDVFKHPHNNCEVEIDANKAFPDTLTVRNHTTLRYCVRAYPSQPGRHFAPIAALPLHRHGNPIPLEKQAGSKWKVESFVHLFPPPVISPPSSAPLSTWRSPQPFSPAISR